MRGMGGFEERCVNCPYQYQRLMGKKKMFIHVSHKSSLRSYSVIMTLAARLGGSKSRIQARRECHFVRKPVMSSQRQHFCENVSWLAVTTAVVTPRDAQLRLPNCAARRSSDMAPTRR